MKISTSLYLFLIFVSIIHLQSSCIRENTEPKIKELPPITSEGKNTIGFLLNDKVWLPGGGAIGRPDTDFVLDTFSHTFRILAYFKDRQSSDPINRQDFILISAWPENICYSGKIPLNQTSGTYYLQDYTLTGDCRQFKKINFSEVNIIFCNLEDKIIAGTFSLEIENECGNVYNITEGRFDAKFRYY